MKRSFGKWQVAGALVLAGILSAQGAQAEVKMKVYGQVNRALLWADDGNESTVYNVDNSNSSTRFGLDAKATLENSALTIGGKFEAEFQSNASTDVNQTQENTDATLKERHMDVWLEGGIGKLSIGQGNMASNETSEVDLSGTSVIAYSDVKMLAGGIIFFDETKGSLYENEKDKKFNPKVKDAFDNFDGLSRLDRVRYDTPSFAGFTAGASYATQGAWDVALRYAGSFGANGTKVAAAIAYSDFADRDVTIDSQINGSASVLIGGLSLTGAAGQRTLDVANRTEDPMFYYGKITYAAKLLFSGSTTFGADYGTTTDYKKDDDEATTWAAFVVQRLDSYNTELYAAYRSHALDRANTDYADVSGMMAGARIKF